MQQFADSFEPMYSFRQIGSIFGISYATSARLFRKRPGVINLNPNGNKPSYRVPASVVLAVMRELGYQSEHAERLMRRVTAA